MFPTRTKPYISIKIPYEARKKKNRVTTLLSFFMMRIIFILLLGNTFFIYIFLNWTVLGLKLYKDILYVL